jgi:hypothetical protein
MKMRRQKVSIIETTNHDFMFYILFTNHVDEETKQTMTDNFNK